MQRFYCTELPTQGDGSVAATAPVPLSARGHVVKLDPDQIHHARRVLRLDRGAAIELFNGRGTVAQAVVESWEPQATVRITAAEFLPPARPQLELAVCLPKGSRADDMVNQLSQLGVDRLIPLRTRRSVAAPRPGRLKRFQRAAIAAAKQCRRAHLLTVTAVADLDQVICRDHDLKLVADPTAAPHADLATRMASAQRLLVLIGPEGGWTPGESAAAQAAGGLAWCFAPHLLRIEAAAAAAAAIVRYLAAAPQTRPPPKPDDQRSE